MAVEITKQPVAALCSMGFVINRGFMINRVINVNFALLIGVVELVGQGVDFRFDDQFITIESQATPLL